MSHLFAGIYTPIVTPFTASGELDESGIAFNVDHYLTTKLTGLVVLGSNGEAAQLEDDEADRVIGIVRSRVPRGRPLLVGTGRESTRATIAACKRAASIGADAVMARTPSFYKPQMTSENFIRHYTEVADASPVPVLLYNVTMYTGVNLLPDAVERLSEHPNIVGLKDSGNDMLQIGDYLTRSKE
jgi:4-hydroxy-2-oxoglutarate aldolase